VKETEDIATAKRMRSDGFMAKDIAKYLGVSRATLYRCLSEYAPPEGELLGNPTHLRPDHPGATQ
jgi:DNA invertase Pin-like site-specific DNA recombinase